MVEDRYTFFDHSSHYRSVEFVVIDKNGARRFTIVNQQIVRSTTLGQANEHVLLRRVRPQFAEILQLHGANVPHGVH